MSVRLLPATSTDAPFLRELFLEIRRAHLLLPDQLLQMQFAAWQQMTQERYPDAECWILNLESTEAEHPSVQAGAALVHFPLVGAIHLVDIAVLPAFQRKGIGTAFLQDLQVQARERGVAIQLFVAKDNDKAVRFYTGLGFHQLFKFPTDSPTSQRQEMIWSPTLTL